VYVCSYEFVVRLRCLLSGLREETRGGEDGGVEASGITFRR